MIFETTGLDGEPIYYEVERETVFGVLEVLIFRPIPAYQLTDDYILNL